MDDQTHPQEQEKIADKQPAAPIPQPNDRPASQPATAQQLQQAETKIEDRMSAFERSMIRLTRAGIIVACITLIVFLGQLYEMWDGGRQTERFSDAADRIDSKIGQAEIAFSMATDQFQTTTQQAQVNLQAMADSARNSQRTIQDQFRLDQRPVIWLATPNATRPETLGVSQIDQGRGNELAIGFAFENFGKSPAYIIWQKKRRSVWN